ncbi:hypothetical protein [Brevundimonas sp.]|uniref:hypothetical protein n=1 Tax=Brevundimonas sp. TaxID=1871086 RepID=UPI0035B18A17
MNHRPTTLERAYQLAESGECASVSDIKKRLMAEHYTDVQGQLYGSAVTTALRKLTEKAAATRTTSGGPD